MKYIEWDNTKNDALKRERGVSFEEAVQALFDGYILGETDHPNQKRHPGQKIYVIQLHDYAFVLPYVEDSEKLFLKSLFPSRKYTKMFLEKGVI